MNYYDEVKRLLELKRNNLVNDDDRKKFSIVERLLQEDNCFFIIERSLAYGILKFLNVPNDKIDEFYRELISPQKFKELYKNDVWMYKK